MRKMVRLGKKEDGSGDGHASKPSVAMASRNGQAGDQQAVEVTQRPQSVHSQKSQYFNAPPSPERSAPTSAPTPTQAAEIDPEALKRTLDCTEITDRQKLQLLERERFVAYRQSAMEQLARERAEVKAKRKSEHDAVLEKKRSQVCTDHVSTFSIETNGLL
jgi:hypothetical protein